MNKEKTLCKNCKCWDSKADGSGFCRRYAPYPAVMKMKDDHSEKFVLVVPSTMANDGCWEGVEAQ